MRDRKKYNEENLLSVSSSAAPSSLSSEQTTKPNEVKEVDVEMWRCGEQGREGSKDRQTKDE